MTRTQRARWWRWMLDLAEERVHCLHTLQYGPDRKCGTCRRWYSVTGVWAVTTKGVGADCIETMRCEGCSQVTEFRVPIATWRWSDRNWMRVET